MSSSFTKAYCNPSGCGVWIYGTPDGVWFAIRVVPTTAATDDAHTAPAVACVHGAIVPHLLGAIGAVDAYVHGDHLSVCDRSGHWFSTAPCVDGAAQCPRVPPGGPHTCGIAGRHFTVDHERGALVITDTNTEHFAAHADSPPVTTVASLPLRRGAPTQPVAYRVCHTASGMLGDVVILEAAAPASSRAPRGRAVDRVAFYHPAGSTRFWCLTISAELEAFLVAPVLILPLPDGRFVATAPELATADDPAGPSLRIDNACYVDPAVHVQWEPEVAAAAVSSMDTDLWDIGAPTRGMFAEGIVALLTLRAARQSCGTGPRGARVPRLGFHTDEDLCNLHGIVNVPCSASWRRDGTTTDLCFVPVTPQCTAVPWPPMVDGAAAAAGHAATATAPPATAAAATADAVAREAGSPCGTPPPPVTCDTVARATPPPVPPLSPPVAATAPPSAAAADAPSMATTDTVTADAPVAVTTDARVADATAGTGANPRLGGSAADRVDVGMPAVGAGDRATAAGVPWSSWATSRMATGPVSWPWAQFVHELRAQLLRTKSTERPFTLPTRQGYGTVAPTFRFERFTRCELRYHGTEFPFGGRKTPHRVEMCAYHYLSAILGVASAGVTDTMCAPQVAELITAVANALRVHKVVSKLGLGRRGPTSTTPVDRMRALGLLDNIDNRSAAAIVQTGTFMLMAESQGAHFTAIRAAFCSRDHPRYSATYLADEQSAARRLPLPSVDTLSHLATQVAYVRESCALAWPALPATADRVTTAVFFSGIASMFLRVGDYYFLRPHTPDDASTRQSGRGTWLYQQVAKIHRSPAEWPLVHEMLRMNLHPDFTDVRLIQPRPAGDSPTRRMRYERAVRAIWVAAALHAGIHSGDADTAFLYAILAAPREYEEERKMRDDATGGFWAFINRVVARRPATADTAAIAGAPAPATAAAAAAEAAAEDMGNIDSTDPPPTDWDADLEPSPSPATVAPSGRRSLVAMLMRALTVTLGGGGGGGDDAAAAAPSEPAAQTPTAPLRLFGNVPMAHELAVVQPREFLTAAGRTWQHYFVIDVIAWFFFHAATDRMRTVATGDDDARISWRQSGPPSPLLHALYINDAIARGLYSFRNRDTRERVLDCMVMACAAGSDADTPANADATKECISLLVGWLWGILTDTATDTPETLRLEELIFHQRSDTIGVTSSNSRDDSETRLASIVDSLRAIFADAIVALFRAVRAVDHTETLPFTERASDLETWRQLPGPMRNFAGPTNTLPE